MSRRVVITGLGVVAPNATGIPAFREALRTGRSGIRYLPELEDLKLGCRLAGIPEIDPAILPRIFTEATLKSLKSRSMVYGCLAAEEAWSMAGLPPAPAEVRPEAGCVFGASFSDCQMLKSAFLQVDAGQSRQLGSRFVEQTMTSGTSAVLGGRYGLGNQVFSNSSACATGTQAILLGYQLILSGQADLMLVGSSETADSYLCSGFDAMRITCRRFQEEPSRASRPMDRQAAGFIPGGGAGALVLEDLESARSRGAHILAELAGGSFNSGGQRGGGSMTAPGSEGVRRCILDTLARGRIRPEEVDLVCGHLTATMADPLEVVNWSVVLGRRGKEFPWINSLKGMTGHCLSAAGSLESVAVVLQLVDQFIHSNVNLEDPHPGILEYISGSRMPTQALEYPVRIALKANFGFGDVNGCLAFRSFKDS